MNRGRDVSRLHSSRLSGVCALALAALTFSSVPAIAATPAAVDQYTEQPPSGPGGPGSTSPGALPGSPTPPGGQAGGAKPSGTRSGGAASTKGGGAAGAKGEGRQGGVAGNRAAASAAGPETGRSYSALGYAVTPFVFYSALAVAICVILRLGYLVFRRFRESRIPAPVE